MIVPKRFALSTLMLVMLVVAAVFGYAQWRRQWLVAEIRQFNIEADPLLNGRTFPLYDDWFWPTVPDTVGAVVRKERHGQFFANGRTINSAEAKEYLSNKSDRLRAVGVKKVIYYLLVPDKRTTPPELRFTKLKDLGELDQQ